MLPLQNEAQHERTIIILSGEWKTLSLYRDVHIRRSFLLNADFIAGGMTGHFPRTLPSPSQRCCFRRLFTLRSPRARHFSPDVRALHPLPRVRLPCSLAVWHTSARSPNTSISWPRTHRRRLYCCLASPRTHTVHSSPSPRMITF